MKTIDELEKTVNSLLVATNKDIAIHHIETIRNQIATLIPHRNRRGLINAGGSMLKWVFGTMDDLDRDEIEKHLTVIDKNNHEVIETVNQQIKINYSFNKSFALIQNAIESDRILLNTKINEIGKRINTQYLFFEQMTKIDFIRRYVETIQDNIASARLGIIHPEILTNVEIKTYNIDSKKLSQIRLGIAKNQDESLIFAIKIPTEFRQFDRKILIPIPNSQGKQIDQEIEYIVEVNNKSYSFENAKSLKELRLSKHCIFKNNCKFITNHEEDYIEIGDDILILNNMYHRNFSSSCDERKFILIGNYFVSFQNCSIFIDNKQFINTVGTFKSHFIIPVNDTANLTKEKLTFEDIVLIQEKNVKEIKELKYQKFVNIGLGSSSAFLVISIAIFVYFFVRKRNFKLSFEKRIQENPYSSGGGVTLDDVTDHSRNKEENVTKISGNELFHKLQLKIN